jgi:Fe-S-cluster containining protein
MRCGACCANTDENRAEGFRDYVQVFPRDALARRGDLLGVYAVRNKRGEIHLRLDTEDRCVALEGVLGDRVRCSLYALRPEVCKRVEAGSEECLRARRERGIDPR